MALEGSLREFSLADILQLMLFQRKTGVLTLQGQKDRVRLLFHEGNIVLAESRERNIESRLGRMLVGQKVVSQEALDAALALQKEKGGRLGSILVREGLVTPEHIQHLLSFQVTETLVQLFSWKDGRYEFSPQAVPVDKDAAISMSTEHLLMEGLRFYDEWAAIKDRISVETVFTRAEGFGGEVSEDERRFYDLVDGVNDVGTIADLTGIDSFQVSTALLGLVEKGAIAEKAVVEAATERARAAVRRRPREWRGLRPMLAAFLIVALVVSFDMMFEAGGSGAREAAASEALDELRLRIEAAHIATGSLPSIKAVDPWGNPYAYKAVDGGFTLFSPGPDGKAGTPDDIY